MKFSGSDVAAASCSSGYDVVAAASCSSGSAASSSSGSDDTATVSSSSETEDYFCTASIFQSTDVIPMPIDSSDDKGVLQMYAVCTHFLAVIPTIQKFLNELKIQPKKKYFQPV